MIRLCKCDSWGDDEAMDPAEFKRWDKPWKRNSPLTQKEQEHNERCARMCRAREKLEGYAVVMCPRI